MEWLADSYQQIGVVALALLCLAVSEMVGASMFIASFVAGLAVQVGFKDAGKHSVEFAEEWGQLFNLSVFFLFGVIVVRDWPQFSMASWLYAILSLTVVRMLPVAIALIGTGLNSASVVVYRLVRSARPSVDCSGSGLSRAGNALGKRTDNSFCRYGNCTCLASLPMDSVRYPLLISTPTGTQ